MEHTLSQSEKFKHLVVSYYEIGLSKMIGKTIKEVRGYVSGDYNVFVMTRIEFEDGTFLGCEGEHDSPYITSWASPGQPEHCEGYTDEVIEEIMDEEERLENE